MIRQWPMLPLEAVCTLITDGTHHSPSNGAKGEYKYVTAKNIRPWGLDLADMTYVDAATHREIYARCPVERDDVLYIKDGATTGLAVLNHLDEAFSMLSSVALLKPRRDTLDARYLKHFLNSPETFSRMISAMNGSAIQRLVLRQIRAAEIPLPPLAEQKLIANRLDSLFAKLDACREHLDRVPQILKRFRQSVLAAAVSGDLTRDWRGTENPIAWRAVSLRNVASDFSYGSASKSVRSGTTPVMRMGNIQNGELDWSSMVYTSDVKEIEKYRLDRGDVLFNRTNSPELVGKTAVYLDDREAIYAGYLIRVKCSPDLLPEFLAYCLNSPNGRDYCWRVKSDGVSQSNINAEKLRAFTFLLPPVQEQAQIVKRVKALFSKADYVAGRANQSSAWLESASRSILDEAFKSGRNLVLKGEGNINIGNINNRTEF